MVSSGRKAAGGNEQRERERELQSGARPNTSEQTRDSGLKRKRQGGNEIRKKELTPCWAQKRENNLSKSGEEKSTPEMWLGDRSRNLICQVTAYFVYILMGAIIFQALESKNELFERQSMHEERRLFQAKFNISDADMDEFLAKVEDIVDHGFNKNWVERWSLMGSLFFAGTVVTTIGEFSFSVPYNKRMKRFT